MSARYDMRAGDAGWEVFDVWTGKTVMIAGVPKDDLDVQDADDLMDLLNIRARLGDREIMQ